MSALDEKYNKRRYKTSYGTTVVSISMVLFMLGLLGLMIFHTKKLSDFVRENIGISIIIKENAGEAEILNLKNRLDSSGFIKSTEYITKEQAAQELTKDLGEDFVDFIGYNPLLPTVEVFLNADYTREDSLIVFEQKLMNEKIVKEVSYQKSLVDMINNNISKVSAGLLGFSSLLLIISIILIFNTIRLAVFSKRMLIKSMLLVGATRSYIQKPFIIQGVLQGFIGSLFAVLLLVLTILFIQNKIPELIVLKDSGFLLILFLSLIVFGIVISWLSNYFAVKKYLNVKSDDLY